MSCTVEIAYSIVNYYYHEIHYRRPLEVIENVTDLGRLNDAVQRLRTRHDAQRTVVTLRFRGVTDWTTVQKVECDHHGRIAYILTRCDINDGFFAYLHQISVFITIPSECLTDHVSINEGCTFNFTRNVQRPTGQSVSFQNVNVDSHMHDLAWVFDEYHNWAFTETDITSTRFIPEEFLNLVRNPNLARVEYLGNVSCEMAAIADYESLRGNGSVTITMTPANIAGFESLLRLIRTFTGNVMHIKFSYAAPPDLIDRILWAYKENPSELLHHMSVFDANGYRVRQNDFTDARRHHSQDLNALVRANVVALGTARRHLAGPIRGAVRFANNSGNGLLGHLARMLLLPNLRPRDDDVRPPDPGWHATYFLHRPLPPADQEE